MTRILINPAKRAGRKLLTNPQAMHAAVRAAFPPDIDETRSRVLWRVDSRGHEHVLYIVGPEMPDAQHIVEQAGWGSRPAQSADYTRLLGSLSRGQQWRFGLVANPVVTVHKGECHGVRGKVLPHVTANQQLGWLQKRCEAAGFSLCDDVAVTKRDRLRFSRAQSKVAISVARFEGTLEVADPDALRHTLELGIGKARAYGCGLLTLAKP